jgi:hypothetical protein
MAVRNTYRSNRGRSAIARNVQWNATGNSNGMMPQGSVLALLPNGQTKLIKEARYFGGDKKGGLAPMATKFMIPSSSSLSNKIAFGNPRPNYLFVMQTQVGMGPRGLPGVGRVI